MLVYDMIWMNFYFFFSFFKEYLNIHSFDGLEIFFIQFSNKSQP